MEDDSSVTMLAVISSAKPAAHTHTPVRGRRRERRINVGVDCETQAFDVEECKGSGIERRKSGLCKPMLASTIMKLCFSLSAASSPLFNRR